MKSIVVYRILVLGCFLLFVSGLAAQKPAIDLISSQHQHRHPEAIADTAYVVNPPVREGFLTPAPPVQNKKSSLREHKQKRRQIGPSLDSLFQKEEGRTSSREQSPAKSSMLKKRFHPLRLIIFIIALN
jgi:hypothetical protein